MRAFLALELPEEVKTYLGSISDEMSKYEREVRWVRAQNQHITLKFFGEIDENLKERIVGRLKDVSHRFSPILASLGDISGFPKKQAAKVIIVTLKKGAEEIKRMAEALDEEWKKIGIKGEEREFSPHITLGRRKSPSAIRAPISVENMEFELKELILFRSTLTKDGPIYDPIFCLKLDERGGKDA